jgi:phosphatidylinositol alpha-mannosyltransferase
MPKSKADTAPNYRIGFVLDDTLDTPDGVQQYVLNLGEWLRSQGHDVHYLVGKTRRTDLANVHSLSRNVAVRFNRNRMSIPLPTSRRALSEFLQQQPFDILHVQLPYSPFMAGRLVRLVPPATAVVGTFHILPYSFSVRQANRLLAGLNRRSARRFDAVLAVSAPAANFARQVYGFQSTVVPNPVSLAQFAGVQNTVSPLRIVFLGRLVERKGALHLLRAVAELTRKELTQQSFKVIIGGKGDLLPRLQAFVQQHELESIVEFAGFIAEADKPAFLAQADVAVFPSTGGESFGIVLLEAMAAARGVVLAGDNPGYRTVMAGREEQLFDPKNTTILAALLARWLDDTSDRQRVAAWQKQYVRQFDVPVVGAQVMAAYELALQKHKLS